MRIPLPRRSTRGAPARSGSTAGSAPRRPLVTAVVVLPVVALASACGATASATGTDDALRLGYFVNVTHAPALVGVEQGLFAEELGDVELTTQVFNAGPAAIEALNAGAIDAAFLGPNPAINGFVKSEGEALRVVSGSTSGGAALVVRPGIDSAEDLRGAELATPQLGGTQDVALRSWLGEQGLETSISGGGDVTITPTENAQTLQLFTTGHLDGAWLPEPWASRLVVDAGAEVLVDEADLWPDGEHLTTHLVVSARFLEDHPATVEALVRGTVASVDWLAEHSAEAPDVVNAAIGEETGAPLSDAVLQRAFASLHFTVDPLAGTLETLLADGVSAGTTEQASLEGIYDLRALNRVLADAGRPAVSAAGLGLDAP